MIVSWARGPLELSGRPGGEAGTGQPLRVPRSEVLRPIRSGCLAVSQGRTNAGHPDVHSATQDRGAARTWLDDSRPAPRRLGFLICRLSSGSSTTGCGADPAPKARADRGLRPLLSRRFVRRAAGQERSGALPRAHALQGDRAVPQGADRSACVHRRGAGQCRDRRGLHALLVHLSLQPLGAGAPGRGRPDDAGAVRRRSRWRPSAR